MTVRLILDADEAVLELAIAKAVDGGSHCASQMLSLLVTLGNAHEAAVLSDYGITVVSVGDV